MSKPRIHLFAAISILSIAFLAEIQIYCWLSASPDDSYAEWAIEWFRDAFNEDPTPHLAAGTFLFVLLTTLNALVLFSIRSVGVSPGRSFHISPAQALTIVLGLFVALYNGFLLFGGLLFAGEWHMGFG
jgi:hypothetical protein